MYHGRNTDNNQPGGGIGMEGQMTIFDYQTSLHEEKPDIQMSFEEFQNVCNGMGGYFNNIKACSHKDKIPAKCWDDWQPCTLANCPYGNHEGQRTEFYRDETGRWQVRNTGESE